MFVSLIVILNCVESDGMHGVKSTDSVYLFVLCYMHIAVYI